MTPACAHGGEHEAEAGDGDGEGVLVYAVDRGQGVCDQHPVVSRRRLRLPRGEEAAECAQKEVAASAGGVDDAQPAREVRVAKGGRRLKAELLDRGVEGVVEDELLDELRGLEEGVGLAGGLGEILVEVAQEAGVPVGVGEIVDRSRRWHR